MPIPPHAEQLMSLMRVRGGFRQRRTFAMSTDDWSLQAFEASLKPAELTRYRSLNPTKPQAAESLKWVERGLRWLEADDHHLIALTDRRYPRMLARTDGSPIALFVQGDPQALWVPSIAVIGSRNPSRAGIDNTNDYVAGLVDAGLSIVSGLAYGIDSVAHRQALDCEGITVAVVGNGLDSTYPRRHAGLHREIAASGAVISEFLPGTPPARDHFPQRNRVIAGLSCATLVMESAIGSGTLITAEAATHQGRDVFAVPGNIHNPVYRGNNELIRNGATLVQSVEQVLDDLHFIVRVAQSDLTDVETALPTLFHRFPEGHFVPPLDFDSDDPDYNTLWQVMDDTPRDMGSLANSSGLTFAKVSVLLEVLASHHRVVSQNGRYRHADRSIASLEAG